MKVIAISIDILLLILNIILAVINIKSGNIFTAVLSGFAAVFFSMAIIALCDQ